MSLVLRYEGGATVPLEVEGLLPEAVAESSAAEIAQWPIQHGKEVCQLGDFFTVSGDASDQRFEWEGDLSGVHWLGAKMRSGQMRVAGHAGRHLGSEMSGGCIHVDGDAGDWVGGEMRGGLIQIGGRAGHLVGAAYRGSARGMTGGTILVHGGAGNEIGHTMRRGLIAIGGRSGDLAGFNMLAGSVLLFGDCGIRHGAGMRRGTLGFFGAVPELLPSFRHACRYRPEILGLLLRQLRRWEFPLGDELFDSAVDLYHGDLITGGRGEVLVRDQ